MNPFSNNNQTNTDTGIQSEIANLSNVVSGVLPIIENLNANLFTCVSASDAIFQTQTDMLNASLISGNDISNAISQSNYDNLNANLFSSAAISDAILQTQTDMLNSNLISCNNASGALFQSLFGGLTGDLNISFEGLNNTLNLSLSGLENSLGVSFDGVNNNIISSFSGLQNNLNSLISGSNNNVTTSVTALKNDMAISITGLQNNLVTSISGAQNGIISSISGLQNNIVNSTNGLQNNMNISISGLQNNLCTNLSKTEMQISEMFKYFKGIFGENKMPDEYFDKTISKDLDEEAINLAKEGNRLSKIGNTLANTSNLIASAALTFEAASKVAEITANLPYGTGVPIGLAILAVASGAAISAISGAMSTSLLFESGGFPSMGQMFIAREAGPELVGTIGNRNAVVNNNQIVESVSSGVYQAVRSALKGGGSESVIQVFIGNDQLDEYIVRSQQRRSLQTNGLYA